MRFRTRPSLIARLRNLNDAEAWREFQSSYRPFIRQVGIDAGVRGETLADLVQDVWLTVVRVIPRFAYDPSRGRFRSWLARIVRSRCSDLARKKKRDASLKAQLSSRPVVWPSASDGQDRHPSAVTLRAALDVVRGTTRPRTWRCFEQHVLQSRPAHDVAREAGTTVNAVYLNSMRVMNRVEGECRRRLDEGQGHESRTVSVNG
jgi:RNA polymerase sigma factor (sigma-70 family)